MRITTYAELRRFVAAFQQGHIGLLIIEGRGGTGKSETVTRALPNALVFKGRASAVAIHNALSEAPTAKVILDDIDSLFNDKNTVAELKQVCETKEDKLVTYHTASPLIKRYQFISNNKVIVLCNDLKKVSMDMKALLTRGFHVEFCPSNAEIVENLKSWAEDEDVIKIVEDVGKTIPLDLRMYKNLCALKDAGMPDWKEYLHREYGTHPEEELVRKIYKLPTAERNIAWSEATGKSPRTYQRLLKKMLKENTI